ncbi:hypothetical protein C8R44DRAFT_767038 [Mycena epipterygia]|nr:hypothetical protein C8R44DRAFT_767038 [Mycena epipterygia]
MFLCLAEHSLRWQELSIGLTSNLVPLLGGLRDRVPLLRRLWIEWDTPGSQAGVQSIDCFERAPYLVDASILNQYRYVPTLFPAYRLTHYDIDAPWKMHEGILTLTPNLVQARIDISFSDESWPDSGEIIDLLRLQRLFVSHANILKYLRAPVLQEIGFYEEEDQNYFLLDSFMLRSGCTLRRLSFDGLPIPDTAAEILRKYPSITELAVVHSSDRSASDLISRLTIPNSTGSAAMSPQLSEISFGCYVDGRIDYTLFLCMLQSRWKVPGCALKTAALLTHSDTGPDAATLRALDVLRREEMDLLVLQGMETSKLLDSWRYIATWS